MAERPRVQRPVAERREQILTAAAAVFAERGVHRSRIDDIAAEAGVSKGTVYWYFSSKDEIVFALVDAFYSQTHSDLVALRDQPGSVAERLRGYLLSWAGLFTEHPHLAPLAMEFYALAPRQPRVRELLERYYAEWAEAAAALLEQGNERGEFQVDDPRAVARTFVELFDGAFLIWSLFPDTVDVKQRMETALELLYRGLAGNVTAATYRSVSP